MLLILAYVNAFYFRSSTHQEPGLPSRQCLSAKEHAGKVFYMKSAVSRLDLDKSIVSIVALLC